MKNKSIIVYREKFKSKILNFLKKFFNKLEQNDKDIAYIDKTREQHGDFVDQLKIDKDITNVPYEKEKFLEEMMNDVKSLSLLSIDRLRQIEKYYDSLIKKNAMIIKKLK